MRRWVWACSLTIAMVGVAVAPGGVIDDELEAVLRETPPDAMVSTLVYLADQVDLAALEAEFDRVEAPLVVRHEVVVRLLQQKAEATQGPLSTYLAERQGLGGVELFRAYWIVNAFRVDALPGEIEAIAARDDVAVVFSNYRIESIQPVDSPDMQGQSADDGQVTTAPEPGLVAIRAPEVWALGYRGEGVLVATLDTGVDGNHPALSSRWRGRDPRYQGHPQWAWFDPVTNTTFPFDSRGHGTHTMGTVCGGPPGNEIGVAPGAQWIHAAVIDRVSIQRTVDDAVRAFQWMVDPDGDPQTNWDVPAACSNSWGLATVHGYPPCHTLFWQYLDACEAAGTVQIFSAGNEGPSARTHRRPADRATTDYNAYAVGAVDGNQQSWPIASFSSRGPSNCTPNGQDTIKPEIVAPGVNVRSSLPGGGYGSLSGTSMASPHINGVVALMRQVNPNLPVNEVKRIIMATARDLGSQGQDNTYGAGMVDAFEAVRAAMPQYDDGDMNCDGVIDSNDINGFILALFDPAEYDRQYPDCDINLADMNGDGRVDSADIQGFIDALFGP